MSTTSIIIRREYLERVTKKSFIITTILVPILMLLLVALPSIIMVFATGDTKYVAVVDDSGLVLPALHDTDEVKFFAATGSQSETLANDSLYGMLIIDSNVMQRPSVRLITPHAASLPVENAISTQVSKIIEDQKLKAYNIDNIDQILQSIKTDVAVQTIRTSDAADEEGENQSAVLAAALGGVLNFILYIFLLLYGAMVMNSIVEEKSNRVLEIVVSSIKPQSLMLGKIIGVGLVAITQIVIWVAIMAVITTALIPMLMPASIMAESQALSAGQIDVASAVNDTDLLMALGMLSDAGFMLKLLGLLLLFLVGGYLLFASIFAAIGASVDNLQDASQLQMLGMAPIMVGIFSSMAVMNDPNSTFAVVMSIFPLTSPMVMMSRVPFGVPAWQLALSVGLLLLSIIFMVWVAAKIYRVGIFMYGQKPTIATLYRWARMK